MMSAIENLRYQPAECLLHFFRAVECGLDRLDFIVKKIQLFSIQPMLVLP